MKIVNVILSGGVGSRLWPLSRKSRPKQYLSIFGGKSLFELTVERNRGVCDQLIVVGGKDNYLLSREALKDMPEGKFTEIVEACPRNTAAAIAFAAFSLDPTSIMLVTPSDQLIAEGNAYNEALSEAFELAKSGNLVTFGLVPLKPETGFGYIEHDGNEVISFREKPSKALAEEFISKGNFLWNSGIFCFAAGVYLSELEKYEADVFHASKRAFEKAKEGFLPEKESLEIPSISVDYAVMEKSDRIKVVSSQFDWSDMGSFEALHEHIPSGDSRKSGSNLVLGSDKKVIFLGVEDVILVETPDAVLVLNRHNAQDVKKIYERLEKDDPAILE